MSDNSLAGQNDYLLSLAEAEAILAPYRDRLSRCIQHGWDVWKTDYAHKRHILHARARAAIVFDEIVACAMEEFVEGPDLKMRRTPTTFMLFIGDSILLRFKKIGKNGRCSNILTRQQILFRAQQHVQLRLPNMQKSTLVHAGYVLDELQQEVIRKSVVCQLENSVMWQMSLALENVEEVKITPPPQSSPAVPIARFEVKAELVVDDKSAELAGKEK